MHKLQKLKQNFRHKHTAENIQLVDSFGCFAPRGFRATWLAHDSTTYKSIKIFNRQCLMLALIRFSDTFYFVVLNRFFLFRLYAPLPPHISLPLPVYKPTQNPLWGYISPFIRLLHWFLDRPKSHFQCSTLRDFVTSRLRFQVQEKE